jgi:hypothetical protein
MDKGRLHVVFGTGQVGSALAAHLAGLGVAVRAAMTAELPSVAVAGRVRLAIGRASDFFGPGVTQGSVASPGRSVRGR